jgi:hypothetical protein
MGVYIPSVENASDEEMDTLCRDVCEAIRKAGNQALAERYYAAFEHSMRMTRQLAHLISCEQRSTDAQLDAASAATDEAEEDFDRVCAEMNAFFQGLDEKGCA